MKFSVHAALQIGLFAIQFLVPGFVPMTDAQRNSILEFVSATQMVLGLGVHGHAYIQRKRQRDSAAPEEQAK